MRPTKGEILYRGEELPLDNEAELSQFRNREIGFVFQQFHLLAHRHWDQVLLLAPDDQRGQADGEHRARQLDAAGRRSRRR